LSSIEDSRDTHACSRSEPILEFLSRRRGFAQGRYALISQKSDVNPTLYYRGPPAERCRRDFRLLKRRTNCPPTASAASPTRSRHSVPTIAVRLLLISRVGLTDRPLLRALEPVDRKDHAATHARGQCHGSTRHRQSLASGEPHVSSARFYRRAPTLFA